MRNANPRFDTRFRPKRLLLLAGLFFTSPLFADTGPNAPPETASAFHFMDALNLVTLAGVLFLAWQWRRQGDANFDTQSLLRRILHASTAQGGAKGEAISYTATEETSEAGPESNSTLARLEELRTTQSQQGLMFEGIHQALIMSISRLEELRKENQELSIRLNELRAAAQDESAVSRLVQKMHKETITGIDRMHVTQSGLVSAFEALKASERRDSSLLSELRAGVSQLNARLLQAMEPDRSLETTVIGAPDEEIRTGRPAQVQLEPLHESLELQSQALEAQMDMLEAHGQVLDSLVRGIEAQGADRRDQLTLLQKLAERLELLEDGLRQMGRLEEQGDALSAQLGELQADVGLVLKARPVRGAGRSKSPYDATLAEEYYTNLQKLIRVLIKNDKASTYALEATQFLYEALQVQTALCELLSSSEFALRISPQALEEGVVRPILRQLGQRTLVPVRSPFEPAAEEEEETSLPDLKDVPSERADWSDEDEHEPPAAPRMSVLRGG